MPSQRLRIAVLAFGFVLVLGQFLLIQNLIATGQLPNPIATHWGFSGAPDGFSDASLTSSFITGIYVLILGLMAYVSFGLRRRLLQPLLYAIVGLVGGFMFLLFSFTMLMQVGIAAEDAAIAPWLLLSTLIVPFAMISLVLGPPVVTLGHDFRVNIRGVNFLTIPFDSLLSAELAELRARDFGGLGVRYAKKTLAFIPSPGPGVLISTNFGESIAIRSKTPELLLAAITAKIGT